jgi:hypothetical protein
VELFLRDFLDRGKLVDAGVVDEDAEAALVLDGRVDDSLGFRFLRDVATNRDFLATGGVDGGKDGIRARVAGGIVHDDRCTLRGERLGDARSGKTHTIAILDTVQHPSLSESFLLETPILPYSGYLAAKTAQSTRTRNA